MIKTFGSITVCFLLSTILQAQSTDEKEVATAVEELRQAMIDGNKSALENLAAEDLSYGHSGGAIEGKAAFVDKIVSGKSDFVTINLTEQTIKIVGNTAIVRHKLTGETKDKDKAPTAINLSVLLVWQKQSGKWKLLARQAIKLL